MTNPLQRLQFKRLFILPGLCLLFLLVPASLTPQKKTLENPGEISLEAIKIIKRSKGVFIYRYPEKPFGLKPYKDYTSVRRITDRDIVKRIRKLLSDNTKFQPNYKKRCLPMYEYGIEFREKKQSRMFLFSFRCNTLLVYEDKVLRDFKKQRTALYALLTYEVNDKTTMLIKRK